MKEVWYEHIQIEYYLKNGKYINGASRNSKCKYSNIISLHTPKTQEISWKDLKKSTLCRIDRTLFKGREYISASYDYDYKRIYEEELEQAIITTTIHVIDLNDISENDLRKQLSFNDYSQLIFDREQALAKEKIK